MQVAPSTGLIERAIDSMRPCLNPRLAFPLATRHGAEQHRDWPLYCSGTANAHVLSRASVSSTNTQPSIPSRHHSVPQIFLLSIASISFSFPGHRRKRQSPRRQLGERPRSCGAADIEPHFAHPKRPGRTTDANFSNCSAHRKHRRRFLGLATIKLDPVA